MSINNWELWHSAREKKAEKQAITRLQKTQIVKDGTISAKDLYKQISKTGLVVKPEFETEFDAEWNYRDINKYARAKAILYWTIFGIAILNIVLLLIFV